MEPLFVSIVLVDIVFFAPSRTTQRERRAYAALFAGRMWIRTTRSLFQRLSCVLSRTARLQARLPAALRALVRLSRMRWWVEQMLCLQYDPVVQLSVQYRAPMPWEFNTFISGCISWRAESCAFASNS